MIAYARRALFCCLAVTFFIACSSPSGAQAHLTTPIDSNHSSAGQVGCDH